MELAPKLLILLCSMKPRAAASIFLRIALLCLCLGQEPIFATSTPSTKSCSRLLEIAPAVPNQASLVEAFIKENPYRYDLFPQIRFYTVENLEVLDESGYNNRGLYAGLYEGQEVVIKTLPVKGGIGEAAWLSFLNRHGLGAQFYAFTKVGDAWAIVMQRVPGINSKEVYRRPGMQIVREMERQIAILLELEVDPMDLQFMIDEATGSVTLIDVGLFSWSGDTGETVEEVMQEKFNNEYRWGEI